MNLAEKWVVRIQSHPGKFLPSVLALLALAIGLADPAPAYAEGNALSIYIVVPRDEAGNLTLPYGEPFEVVITNLSNEPCKIWEEECQPGNRSLTFRIKSGDGKVSMIQKRDVSPDVWIRELGYSPRTRTIPPKGREIRAVNLSEFFWGERAWQNVPEPNSGQKIQITALFEIATGGEARTNGLWSGKIESAPLTVQLVDPKLSTPHDYLWNGCPQQALMIMKSDPSWIKKTDDMECTPLHHAARFGPKEVVVWLVENGADVNAKCYNQFTPLYFAASFGNLDILKYLISKGADLEAPSAGGTPLQAAAQDKHPEIVKALIEAGAKYDIVTAIYRSDEGRVKTLLDENPALAHRPGILQMACQSGNVTIVSRLIENGADPNEHVGMWQDSPLLWALPYPSVVKLLLEKGADPNIRLHINGLPFGSTLLHETARKGELESARLLIDHGAEIDAIYVDQMLDRPAKKTVFTPLHSAAAGGQPKLVQLLLERKADPNRRTSAGQNALQLAGSEIRPADNQKTQEENQRYAEIVRILAARGLEMDFFTAIALGDLDQVSAMLEAKPERIGEKDSEGSLPLNRAVEMNQLPIAQKLLQAGADLNGVGRYGWTPLIEAAFWGRVEMVRLLLDKGANPDIKAEHDATALSEAQRVLPSTARKQDYEDVIGALSERAHR